MNKILYILIIAVLLFPALFVIANPTYDFEDVRNQSQGIDYYSIFDSSRIGVPLERPISYSLMDYTPTYYNWFDITSEYTSFPTLGDPIGSGNSTVQPGEIPLVPMNTDIRYDNVLASFSAERNDLATYILYHDSAYIYSVIITHSMYDMTKVYAFESDPMDNAILIVDIVRGSGVDSPGLVHVDCRADFHDVVFTTTGNADLFFYRMNVDGNTARYMIFMENVGTENIILIKAGAKVYTGDMASPYPTPSWFDVFGAQGATVTYNESYVPGTITGMPTIPTAPTYDGTTRTVKQIPDEPAPYTYTNPTLGRNIIVDASGSGDYTTLADAVANASDGDVLEIVGTHTLNTAVSLNKSLKITGTGTLIGNDSTVSDAKGTLTIAGGKNCHIEGITITTPYRYAVISHSSTVFLDLTINSTGSPLYQIFSSNAHTAKIVVLGGNYNGNFVQGSTSSIAWFYGGNFTHTEINTIYPVRGNVIIHDVNCSGSVNIGVTTPSTNNHILGGTFTDLRLSSGTVAYIHESADVPTVIGGTVIYPCYQTIQSAIDASTNGDIVQVMDGIYDENINMGIKEIWLKGSGYNTIINSTTTFIASNNGKMSDLSLTGTSSSVLSVGNAKIFFVNNVNFTSLTAENSAVIVVGFNAIIIADNIIINSGGSLFGFATIDNFNTQVYLTNSTINKHVLSERAWYSGTVNSGSKVYIENTITTGTIYSRSDMNLTLKNVTAPTYDFGDTSIVVSPSITADTITLSNTASLTADSVVATTVTVAPTATLNVGWVVKPSGAMPVDRSTVQAVHDELHLPTILDGASSIPGGTEYSFAITEMETLGVYNPAMQVLYHGFPMDITAITDLKSHDQLQTIIYYNGGFMCYEGGEWVITYNVTGADRTAWESRQGFTLMGFSANKTGDMIEFYVSYVAGESIANQIQFKDSNTYNVFTRNYGMSMLDSPVTGIGTTLWYNWWASPTPGGITLRGYDGSGHYNLDRNYTIDWYFGVAHTVYFTDAIMPKIDGVLYASDLRFAGQPAHLFNVFVTQKDIVYQKSGTNVTIPNTHIAYRMGEHTTYVKNANYTSYTVTASNLSTVTATHGDDIPMGFLTVTESYMFYSDNTFMVFTEEGVLIRAAQLPGVTVTMTEDSTLVFEGNYRYLTVKYGDAYLINFGKSLTVIAPNGTVTIYQFTEAFNINTIRVFDGVNADGVNASGFYINGVIYLETEFVGGGDLHISTLYDFSYTLYDTSDTEFFDTSYLKLSGSLMSSAVSSFPMSDFSALYLVIGDFSSGRFTVTVGDVQLECRRDGLNYRFIVDGNEIFIRTSNQAFVVSLVREYEQYTMTVTQVRIVGTSYEQLSPSSTLTWADTDDAQASGVVIAYSSADARIYDILVKTASMSVSLPDRMMTDQSNIVTGDGLSMGIEYWEIGTSMTLGDWVITRVSAYNLAVTYTPDNVTRAVAYRDAFSAIWDDGLTVNDVTLFENTSIPASLDVSGYVRYSAVSGVDVTVTSEKVLRAGALSFDLQEYALYVLILAIMSASAVAYISRRYGFAWMDMIEFYGATLFLILGAMAVLGVA